MHTMRRRQFLACLLVFFSLTTLLRSGQPQQVLAAVVEAEAQEDSASTPIMEGAEEESSVPSFWERRGDLDPAFLEEGLAYYREIAGYKVRDVEMNHAIKKWISPLRLGLDDRSDAEVKKHNRTQLDQFLTQLNQRGFLPPISLQEAKQGPYNVSLAINKQTSLRVHGFSGMDQPQAYYFNWTFAPLA